jgi:molecular chaperone HtpG
MARPKTKAFQTETKQLLQLMIHSLYSNKEIFLRELISNASDALDKLRFKSLEDSSLQSDYAISISLDPKNNIISISDNGIGMTEAELIENIGTIAKSGTASFLNSITGDKQKDSQLIGQFGVGFYSVFMVAKEVEVHSKSAVDKEDDGRLWKSSGEDTYELSKKFKDDHGTTIMIHLNDENKEFIDESRVSFIISKYSQYINFPIYLSAEGMEKKRLNDNEAIWLKSKRSVKEDEYKEFYKYLSHDFDDPLLWIHNKVEGKQEYSNLLYIPKKSPFDLWNRDTPKGLKLFIQRVFIMDDAAHFLPIYLRFVKGVIDSSDLPLNVSREILQEHPLVDSIKKALTKRVLDALKKLKKDDMSAYQSFWHEFGLALKEGPAEDYENKDEIASLFIFASSKNDDDEINVDLDSYIERMDKDQDKIYYCLGDTYEAALNSPHIESLKKADTEVLLLTDRIDEWLMTTLSEYNGKELVNAAKADLDDAESKPKVSKDNEKLIERIASKLKDEVAEVVASSRLVDSAARLVTAKHDPGIQMRKILESAGQKIPDSKPSLEVNLKHKLIKKLDTLEGREFTNLSKFLLDYAIIAEGGSPKDPSKYLRHLDKFLI